MAWKNTSWWGWTPILAGISYSLRPWATKASRVRRRMSCSVTPAATTSSWVRYHTSLPMLILLEISRRSCCISKASHSWFVVWNPAIRMNSNPESSTKEVLAGLVERVIFHNAENGVCVLRAKARGHCDLVTIVGHAAVISAGDWITATGEWVNDRTHGQQFRAKFFQDLRADLRRGHRAPPRLRHDPRHRPGL